MDLAQVRSALYEKYIVPTQKAREDFIGIEIEMPIVNLAREAVDFAVVHHLTEAFLRRFGFVPTGRDEDGHVYSAACPETGDILSYDCSYNNLELSMGKERQLQVLDKRFRDYYSFLQSELSRSNYTLTGMGVNPHWQYNHNVPIPSERYRMLFHYLNSYPEHLGEGVDFHHYPAFGTFASASQVQLDVSYDKLAPTVHAFSHLEPVKAWLFSNAVLLGEREDLVCIRDLFWENSMHGLNPHNIGMFRCSISDVDDLLAYIETTSLYCVERGGKYINFAPIPIMEYFEREAVTGEYYENGGYHQLAFRPELGDIQYLRTFKFEDVTFRGTIEFRSVCCQPIRDRMCMAAFHLGLKNKVDELNDLLNHDHILFHHGYSADELRKLLVRRKLPHFVTTEQLRTLSYQVLDLSKQGLQERGYGEEAYLLPLYRRADEGRCPAERMLSLLESGTALRDIILDYAALD